MIDMICGEIRNYFERDIRRGDFEIQGGVLSPSDFLLNGQYFRVVGSVFNDGVHQFPADELTDEVFTGEVWAMAVPPSVIALADDIKAYVESDAAKPTAYVSESFGGYTYTRATDANGVTANEWEKVFAKRLNRWRKI